MRKLLQWSWWTGSVSRRIGVITLLTMVLIAAVAFVSLRGLHALNSELDVALEQLEASRKVLGERGAEISARLSSAPNGISEHTEHAVQAVALAGHGTYDRTLAQLLPMLVALAAAMIVSHVLLRSTVIKPMQRVARAAEQLAQGDFDIDLTSTSADECGHMLQAMASLRSQLASMIDAISSASRLVATTADNLADDNHDFSSRTNEQARAFRQASQALEALNVMAQKSADGARQVSGDMQQAFSSAQHGNAVIVQAVATMQTTAEACRRIADTVGMIDEIAFKTNILALNAAVEAARAGEHGRSFAVVAAEVRELAGKSATAAKEIAALIDSSCDAVARGSELVGEAGVAMETIVRQVRDAAGRMSDISTASREQSVRAGQVTSAMSEINSGTKRNAGMVSQAAASTATLRGEARALMASVGELAHQREPKAA